MKFHHPSRIIQSRVFWCLVATLIPLLSLPSKSLAEQTAATRREQLLNGLNVIILTQPADPQVFLRLRIHSGAAFDLAGKEGLTSLLADLFFPDPNTRQYVSEELGGQLNVNTTYDYIEITLSGHAQDFERLAELLRNAVVNPRLNAEEIARVREQRAKTLGKSGITPAAIADRAVAARLFGSYPYGRTVAGTPETLARIERGDLLGARDRFINPNNATLVCMGGVEASRAMRAFRQFLGGWRKSENIVPSTFRESAPPDARTLIINQPGASMAEVRLALRGLSRADRDYPAALVLAAIARLRWQGALGEVKMQNLVVSHEAHALSGVFRMSANVLAPAVSQTLTAARSTINSLATTQPSATELEQAKREALAAFNNNQSSPLDLLSNEWLDAVTYNSTRAEAERALSTLTPGDVQRVAMRLFKDAPIASIVVGDAAQLRTELARLNNGIEIEGESKAVAPKSIRPTSTPLKKP